MNDYNSDFYNNWHNKEYYEDSERIEASQCVEFRRGSRTVLETTGPCS